MADRFKVDCRKFPSDQGCTVTMSGSIDEVVELGWLHAKTHHAHKDDEEKELRTGSGATPKRRATNQTVGLSR